MRRYRVQYSLEAKADIRELRDYITRKRSRGVAAMYLKRVRSFCDTLALSPHRGEQGQRYKDGLRAIGFENRISIVFEVDDARRIVAFLYAGRTLS